MKAFTIYASMIGFDLDGFEGWLDSLGDCPAKQELNERLQRAEAAFQAQSEKDERIHIKPGKDDGEIVRNLEWCMTRRMMIERESEILPAARMGAEYSQDQSERGKAGADARWNSSARQVVSDLIESLKGRRYEDLRAPEKWEELLSLMQDVRWGEDREPLRPDEKWVDGDADKSTISYRGDGGKPLTYKTFKNRLSS